MDTPGVEIPKSKQKHIESREPDAICLCGEKVVAYKNGLFVCPNAEKKGG